MNTGVISCLIVLVLEVSTDLTENSLTAVLVELAQRNAFPVPSISSNLVLLGHCSTTNFAILAILVFKPTCVLKCIVHFKILFVFNLFVELAYSAQNSSMLQFFFLNPWLCENVK